MANFHSPDDQFNVKESTAPELSASLFLAEIMDDALKLLLVESIGVHELQSQGQGPQCVPTSSTNNDCNTLVICSNATISGTNISNVKRAVCDRVSGRNVRFDSELVQMYTTDLGNSNPGIVPVYERCGEVMCKNATSQDDFYGGKLLPECLLKKADFSGEHKCKSIPDETVLCMYHTQQVCSAEGLSTADGNLLKKNRNGGLSMPLASFESSAKKMTSTPHDLIMSDCETVLKNIITVIASQSGCIEDEASVPASCHEADAEDQTDERMDLTPALGENEEITPEVNSHPFAGESCPFPGEKERLKSSSTEDEEEVCQSHTCTFADLDNTLNLAIDRCEQSSKRIRLSPHLDRHVNLHDQDCTSDVSTANVDKDATLTNKDESFAYDTVGKSDEAHARSLDVSLFDEVIRSSTEPMQTVFSSVTTHPPFNSISSMPVDKEIYHIHSSIHSDEHTDHRDPAKKEPLHGCSDSGQETYMYEGNLPAAADVGEHLSGGCGIGEKNGAELFLHKMYVNHTSSDTVIVAQDQPMPNEIVVELEVDKQNEDIPEGRYLLDSSTFDPRGAGAEETSVWEDQTGEEAQTQSGINDQLSKCETGASFASCDSRLVPEDQSNQRDNMTKLDDELKVMDTSEARYLPASAAYVPYSSGVVNDTPSLEDRSSAKDTHSVGSGRIAPVSDDQEVPTSGLLPPSDQSVDRLLEIEESIYLEQADAQIEKCCTDKRDHPLAGSGNEGNISDPAKVTIPDHLQTIGQPLSGVFLWSRTLHPEAAAPLTTCTDEHPSPSDSPDQTVLTPVRPLPPCLRKTRRVGLSRRQLVFPLHTKKFSSK